MNWLVDRRSSPSPLSQFQSLASSFETATKRVEASKDDGADVRAGAPGVASSCSFEPGCKKLQAEIPGGIDSSACELSACEVLRPEAIGNAKAGGAHKSTTTPQPSMNVSSRRTAEAMRLGIAKFRPDRVDTSASAPMGEWPADPKPATALQPGLNQFSAPTLQQGCQLEPVTARRPGRQY
jgi:hypothetical protein